MQDRILALQPVPIQLRLTVWTAAKTSITFRLMSDVGAGAPISRESYRANLQMFAYVHLPVVLSSHDPVIRHRQPSTFACLLTFPARLESAFPE